MRVTPVLSVTSWLVGRSGVCRLPTATICRGALKATPSSAHCRSNTARSVNSPPYSCRNNRSRKVSRLTGAGMASAAFFFFGSVAGVLQRCGQAVGGQIDLDKVVHNAQTHTAFDIVELLIARQHDESRQGGAVLMARLPASAKPSMTGIRMSETTMSGCFS